MGAATRIRQGGDLKVVFSRGGEDIAGFICTMYVKQHAKDTATISRVIPPDLTTNTFPALITPIETVGLVIGQWNAFALIENPATQEARQIADGDIRFEVAESIVG